MQLWNYIQMPAISIAGAVSSMAAQNVGAGRRDRVGSVALAGVTFTFLLGGTLIAINYLLNREALGLFLPAGGEAIHIATHLNALVVWSFGFFRVTIVLFGVVRATGAVIAPLLILMTSLWLVRVPFAHLLIDKWSADAIWLSFPLSSPLSMLMAVTYYRYGGWRDIRLGVAPVRAVPAAGV